MLCNRNAASFIGVNPIVGAIKVYIIYRKDKIRAEPMLIAQLEKDKKVEFLYNTNVVEALGSKILERVKLDNGKKLEVQGLVIEV